MAPASFPEIESPSLRKSGVVLESEELRSSAIGQTSRDVGHATNLLNDEFFFDCDWRAENITFRGAGRQWNTGEFRERGWNNFFVFCGPVLAEEDIGRVWRPLGPPCFAKASS
jgi:hypothetical protein